MARPTSVSAVYIKELILKFPDHGDRTLATLAYLKRPKLFKNKEEAYGKIKYYRGHAGDSNRKHLKDKSTIKPINTPTENKWELPLSSTKAKVTWNLPTSLKKVAVISDIHFPYQDNDALKAVLDDCLKEDVDAFYINGDMLDFYSLSFHEKDPSVMDVAMSLEMGQNFFKLLKTRFPKAQVYYVPGNHEIRLERYLRVKAPELLDMKEFHLDILLKVAEIGVHYIPHSSKCYMGNLLVEHGDKMKGAGGVDPARTLFMRFKRDTLCGHFHRTKDHLAKIYDGTTIMTHSTGCLCELEPGYMELNEHNHGYALVHIKNGKHKVENKKIFNGKIY